MTVSVCIIAYNHGAFIAQAIESVLMQETSFNVEIIIGEDCSKDNTRQICKAYQEKYPDKIHLQLPEQNVGMMRNVINVIQAAKGEYIALLEGDDYWTDKTKLEKQVNVLNKHPEVTLVFHKGDTLVTQTNTLIPAPDYSKQFYSFEVFASQGCIMKTMSVMFRNLPKVHEYLGQPWVLKLDGADHLLYLLLTMNGEYAYCINECMGVYRKHPGGVWTSASLVQKYQNGLNNLELYRRHLPLSFRQRAYLNWLLKLYLVEYTISKLHRYPSAIRRAVAAFFNYVVFFPGPGYISSFTAMWWYKLIRKWKTSNNAK